MNNTEKLQEGGQEGGTRKQQKGCFIRPLYGDSAMYPIPYYKKNALINTSAGFFLPVSLIFVSSAFRVGIESLTR